jgi:hypothetical protein
MTDLNFTLRELDPSRELAGLVIRLGDAVLTRLVRPSSNTEDIELRIPPGPLGIWLAENWWRLRWECRPPKGITSEWREAHDMAAIGAGHAWPSIAFWGEGRRIMVLAKADAPGVMGPVRFLQDALSFVLATSFEAALNAVFGGVSGMLAGEDRVSFQALISALQEERDDANVSAWRRLEAINGFDPDLAPEELISSLLQLSKRFGSEDIEEAAAACPGVDSARTVTELVDDDSAKRFTHVSFAEAVREASIVKPGDRSEPWRVAELTASRVRNALDAGEGPLLNRRLADLLEVDPHVFRNRPTTSGVTPYGIRLRTRDAGQRVLLQARWSHDRRFELMRALGDAIWSENSQLGPLSRAGTARQKFQRAFAATMLCPLTALNNYLGNVDPSDEDITAAARHFHVSEHVVRSILVNKHMMDRTRIDIPANAARAGTPVEDIADAA